MLHKFCKKLRNYDFGFNNWKFIQILESQLETIQEDSKLRSLITHEFNNNNLSLLRKGDINELKKYTDMFTDQLFGYIKSSVGNSRDKIVTDSEIIVNN
jgi:hypothetical protein